MLNAFRHHGVYRAAPPVIGVGDGLVLNAFRHHGVYRSHNPERISSDPPCAQRLSASRSISAAGGRGPSPGAVSCSTPFGITEYIGGQRGQDTAGSARVLNAFRHHGVYRKLSATSPARGLTCAQRLSASRSISVIGAVSGAGWTSSSAQRLSASRSISAFRLIKYRRHARCSTPFGITEYIGRQVVDTRTGPLNVLNAFRHHGVYRRESSPDNESPPKCAQRLSASRSISVQRPLGIRQYPLVRQNVLNAFRHHGVYRG